MSGTIHDTFDDCGNRWYGTTSELFSPAVEEQILGHDFNLPELWLWFKTDYLTEML